jgi:hypothetical protein
MPQKPISSRARAALTFLAITLWLTLPVSGKSTENIFLSDVVLVDLFGLGSFNRGAEGDLRNQIAKKSLPAGVTPAMVGIQEKSMQFSGRPGWGGGIGVTGLLTRNLGINVDQSALGRAAGDGDMEKADFGYLRYQTSAGLVLRLPIEKMRLAPYAIIGGGAQYGSYPKKEIVASKSSPSTVFTLAGQGFGQIGGGVEWRVIHRFGVFSDLRWMYSGVGGLPSNQLQFRYGVRMAF